MYNDGQDGTSPLGRARPTLVANSAGSNIFLLSPLMAMANSDELDSYE